MDLLSEFNRQVLKYQDDAYTLAWHLSSSDQEAEAITQAAVVAAYSCFAAQPADCRLILLEQVIAHARAFPSYPYFRAKDEWKIFRSLNETERLSLALVDGLGLNYQEAALVSGCSLAEMRRFVARARRKYNEAVIEGNAVVAA